MLSIFCITPPPPVLRGLNGACIMSFRICSGGFPLLENGNEDSDGVVGVALRDFEVGKSGKAQSCESERSGEGTGAGRGEVALREGIWYGDFRPFTDRAGDAVREMPAGFGECKAG